MGWRVAPGPDAQALGILVRSRPPGSAPVYSLQVATAGRALGTALGLGLGHGRPIGSSISSPFPPLPGHPKCPRSPPQSWGGEEPYQASFL